MGYTASGGPDGLGVFNKTPSTASDFNKGLELLAMMGNTRKGVEADRDAISGAELYPGLLFTYTDKKQVDLYDGSGWVVLWAAATAWSTLTAASGWTAGTGSNAPQVSRQRDLVTFRGSLFGGAAGTDSTVLPSWARPSRTVAVPVLLDSGTAFGIATIFAGGSFQLSGNSHARSHATWSVL